MLPNHLGKFKNWLIYFANIFQQIMLHVHVESRKMLSCISHDNEQFSYFFPYLRSNTLSCTSLPRVEIYIYIDITGTVIRKHQIYLFYFYSQKYNTTSISSNETWTSRMSIFCFVRCGCINLRQKFKSTYVTYFSILKSIYRWDYRVSSQKFMNHIGLQ